MARIRDILSALSPGARRSLAFVLVGSVLVSLAETGGMLLIVPLMLLITGADPQAGALGRLSGFLGDPDTQTLGTILAFAVVAAFVLKAVTTVAFRWWMMGVLAREQVQTSAYLLRHFVAMPYVRHLQRGPATLMRSIGDAVSAFYGSVVIGGISAVTELLAIAAIVVALVIAAPLPSLILCAYFALAALGYRRATAAHMRGVGERMTELSVRVFEAAWTVIGGIKTIKLRANSDRFVDEYHAAGLEQALTDRRSRMLNELPKYLLEVLFIVGVGLTTVIVFSQEPSAQALGVLALFVAAGFRVLPGIARLLGALNGVTVSLPYADLLIAELREARELEEASPRPSEDPVPLPFRREISLDDVHFRYPDSERDVIDGVSLRIPQGCSVAFVGGSGAGKTTLVDLILGLHAPTSGRILVDGVDIAAETRRWQAGLAMVPQDVYLLDRSLGENIALGVGPQEVDAARLRTAVEHAQLSDLVAELPAGLDAVVGDRGARLSGGQRQRIGIARALYHDPSLLVLDEATSALDNLTERRIADTIEELAGDMTVVVVAHRLSTVRHCDAIVYLEDGRVAAVGTFAEVQRQSPAFARLVALGRLDDVAPPQDAELPEASP